MMGDMYWDASYGTRRSLEDEDSEDFPILELWPPGREELDTELGGAVELTDTFSGALEPKTGSLDLGNSQSWLCSVESESSDSCLDPVELGAEPSGTSLE